jgi:hypothetical protein
MKISQLHFFLMLLSFLLEDAPGLCLFAIVQQSTGDFSDVQKAQLGTSLVGSAVFIVLAYRKCKCAQRAAQQAWSCWVKLFNRLMLRPGKVLVAVVVVAGVVWLVESGWLHYLWAYFGFGGYLACTGSSTDLSPDECGAWQDLYASTNGPNWDYCDDSRSDPCSCGTFAGSDKYAYVTCTGVHITHM